jgi:hypothetical protein
MSLNVHCESEEFATPAYDRVIERSLYESFNSSFSVLENTQDKDESAAFILYDPL